MTDGPIGEVDNAKDPNNQPTDTLLILKRNYFVRRFFFFFSSLVCNLRTIMLPCFGHKLLFALRLG